LEIANAVVGILKGRFRWLKLPIYLDDKAVIDSMFFTYYVMHNTLLTEDGYDRRWEDDINWAGQAGNHDPEDTATIFSKHLQSAKEAEEEKEEEDDVDDVDDDDVFNNYALEAGFVLSSNSFQYPRSLLLPIIFAYRHAGC
jgi:hypothetical protein